MIEQLRAKSETLIRVTNSLKYGLAELGKARPELRALIDEDVARKVETPDGDHTLTDIVYYATYIDATLVIEVL